MKNSTRYSEMKKHSLNNSAKKVKIDGKPAPTEVTEE